MKILYYSPHPTINMAAPSGPGTHIREIIGAFENSGHTVVRFIAGGELMDNQQGPIRFKKRAIKKLIPSIIWQTLKDRQLKKTDALQKAQLQRLIKEEKPDAIYERAYYLMSSGYEAAAAAGIPYYCEINAPYPQEKTHMEGRSLLFNAALENEKKQVLTASKVFTVSHEMKNYLHKQTGAAESKIIVTPNAVNPAKIKTDLNTVVEIRAKLNWQKGDCIIGFVGSIFPYHGVDTLLHAYKHLKQNKHSGIKLLIVGDGETLPELKEIARSNNLDRDVLFTGNIPHHSIFSYIDAMDITVMARSNWYGSPVKIFEYGALGKKIIAPNVGPVRDVMEHLQDGYLTEQNPKALLEALLWMLENPMEADKAAEHFKNKIFNNYTWQHIGETILKEMQ